MRSIFSGAKKCGGAKYHKGAKPRLAICVARAAEGGEAFNDLLCAVWAYFISLYIIVH